MVHHFYTPMAPRCLPLFRMGVLFCCGLLASIPLLYNECLSVRISNEMDIYHEYLKQGLERGRPDLWSSGHLNPFKESTAGCDTQEAGEQGESSTSFGDSWPWVRCRLFTISNTSNLAHH